MKEESRPIGARSLKSASLFTVCLFASFLLPVIAIYGGNLVPFRDQLFFFPQMAFPYDAVVSRDTYASRRIFGESAIWLSVLQWGVVGIVFSYLTRRAPVIKTILLAVTSIIVVTVVVGLVINWTGAKIEYDAP